MVSQLGFTAEYVDTLSPADREVYINYYKEDERRKQQQQQSPGDLTNSGSTIGSPIDTGLGT